MIEKENIAAPAPIEQRWTRSSTSLMSVASTIDRETSPASTFGLHSWVGIIMYLSTEDSFERKAITNNFFVYRSLVANHLDEKYNAFVHWAKLEVPSNSHSLETLRKRIHHRFPIKRFNYYRQQLDPHSVLSNNFIHSLFDDSHENGGAERNHHTNHNLWKKYLL